MYVQWGVLPPSQRTKQPKENAKEGKKEIMYKSKSQGYHHVRDLRGSVASCRRH